MAQTRVYTESVITLNGQQANQTMQALQNQADSLRQKMLEATKLGDIEGAKDLQRQLDACNKSMSAIKRETKDWGDVLNNLNGSTLGELQKAAQGLNRQIKNLKPGTQEFIDKSQQLTQVKARMNEIQGKTKEVQSQFATFFSKIGWVGLVAAAGAAFKKVLSDMKNMTQTVGDEWRAQTASWQAAYHSFIADMSAGTGWTEMMQNMARAAAAGYEVAKALDEIFERQNSLNIAEAEADVQIAQWEQDMRDVTKTNEERMAAAQNIIDKEKELGDIRLSIAQQEADARRNAVEGITGLSAAEQKRVIDSYNANRESINNARKYLDTIADMEARIDNLSRAAGDMDHGIYVKAAADLEEAKEKLREFKESAAKEVVELAEIVKKYDRSNDELIKNYSDATAKVKQTEANNIRNTSRAQRTLHSLQKENTTSHIKTVNEAYQKEVKASETHFRELQNQAKQAYASGEISEQEYQNRISTITKAGWEAKLKLAQKHKEDTTSILSSLLDVQIQERKKMEDMEKASLKEMDDYAAQVLKEGETLMREINKEIESDMQEQVEKEMELMNAAQEVLYSLNPALKLQDEFQEEMEHLQEMYDAKLLSEEEFQEAKDRLIKQYRDKQSAEDMKGVRNALKNAQQMLQQAGSLISALQSAHEASLDARMQKELTAAGDNADERQRIEEEYEQKKLVLQKKYADVDMGIQIAQAIAAAALASVQAWNAAGGNPIAAGIIIALIAATTAAQVATIIAQRNAIRNQTVATSSSSSAASSGARVATGYSEGGYTRSAASDTQEVGVVHANEWVAPAAMVRADPITFARLESRRRSGNFRSGLAGYADGGYVSENEDGHSPITEQENSQNGVVMQELVTLLRELKASMPLKSYVVLSELNKEQEIQNKAKSIVSRS